MEAPQSTYNPATANLIQFQDPVDPDIPLVSLSCNGISYPWASNSEKSISAALARDT